MTSQFAPVTDFKKKNCAPAARFKKISRLRRALKKKNRACGALQKNFAPAARFKKKIIKKPENPIKNRSKLTLTIFDHQKVLETGNWKLESFQFPVLIIFNVTNTITRCDPRDLKSVFFLCVFLTQIEIQIGNNI